MISNIKEVAILLFSYDIDKFYFFDIIQKRMKND